MKYITTEGMDERALMQAGKARLDAIEVANRLGYKTLAIPAKNGVRTKKWQKPIQFLIYKNNSRKWDKTFRSLKDGDTVLLQYPLVYTAYNFYEIVQKHSKRLKFNVLVHDIESIRFKNDHSKSEAFIKRINNDDRGVLTAAKKVISHNKKMSNSLESLGVKHENIINLEIFDYIDKDNKKAKISKKGNVIIAGNLILEKSRYLSELKTLKGVNFSLYGVSFDKSCASENVHYKGSFSPDKLTENLSGSFGLVWDGDTIKTCSGLYGNYLRYNNPHKMSLYLSSGIPVITWSKSAFAEFVEKNNLGLTVNSLEDLADEIKKISSEDYEEKRENVEKIAKKLKSGFYLEKAIKEAEK